MPARGFITTQPMTTIKYRLLICTKKILTAALLHVLHPLRASISITKTEWDVKNFMFYTTNKLRRSTYFCTPSGRQNQERCLDFAQLVRSPSFSYPLKKGCKKLSFFSASFFAKRMNFARFFNSKAL